MKFFKNNFCLILILLAAAVLRFWQLGSIPPSPDWDEAALGYNAYSILVTGRDEYGTKFPLVLRSFDDYKPPLYAYLAIPSIALFGLNTWSVRLPSAVAGVLAVVGTYFLVMELFQVQKGAIRQLADKAQSSKEAIHHSSFIIHHSNSIALVSAMLLALSPWHLQFSRIAFEANIGLTLNIWAIAFFFFGLKKKGAMIASASCFALGLYAYHSERIFLPLIVCLLAYLYRRELLAAKKKVLISSIVGIIIAVPLIPVFFNQTTLMRFRGTSSLADQTGLLARSVAKLAEDQKNHNPLGIIFDNRRIVWAKTILDGYLSHYSLRWLFLTGDNDRHHAPGMGLLYLWELPFLLYGIYQFAKTGNRAAYLIFGWFLIAPIAASPTSETPHAIRSIVFLPTFQIFTAYGIVSVCQLIHVSKFTKRLYLIMFGIYAIFIVFNFVQYLDLYFVQMNREFSRCWQYGYQEAVAYTQLNRARYKKIVVSTKLEQPHMFFLYFLKYDPVKYLAEGGTASGGFAENRNRFDIYEFRPIAWNQEIHDFSTLYIGTPREVPPTLKLINYLDGSPAISLGE